MPSKESYVRIETLLSKKMFPTRRWWWFEAKEPRGNGMPIYVFIRKRLTLALPAACCLLRRLGPIHPWKCLQVAECSLQRCGHRRGRVHNAMRSGCVHLRPLLARYVFADVGCVQFTHIGWQYSWRRPACMTFMSLMAQRWCLLQDTWCRCPMVMLEQASLISLYLRR